MQKMIELFELYSQLRFEQDGRDKEIPSTEEESLIRQIERLKNGEVINLEEPSLLSEIISKSLFEEKFYTVDDYYERLKGAIVARFAGCTLGVPVEGYQIDAMEKIAQDTNTPFPPTEYWHDVINPNGIQYGVDKRSTYSLKGINCVPVDDDVTYTVLNVLLLGKYGKDYSLDDVAQLWKDVLPYACTAEECALDELAKGTKPSEVANNNPFIEWIGAAIRADAFGYVFAGRPHLAAIAAYNDAYLTHRRNGIYGEMFLAASIAAAFTSTDCIESLKIGANYIPQNSRLKRDLDWAFDVDVTDFKQARGLLDERFPGMNSVHTINNMCAIVLAARLGANDFDKTISTIVAMGLDNDCNGASLGSIIGAILKIDNIPSKWYENFNDCLHTYIKDYEVLSLEAFIKQTEELYKKYKEVK